MKKEQQELQHEGRVPICLLGQDMTTHTNLTRRSSSPNWPSYYKTKDRRLIQKNLRLRMYIIRYREIFGFVRIGPKLLEYEGREAEL